MVVISRAVVGMREVRNVKTAAGVLVLCTAFG